VLRTRHLPFHLLRAALLLVCSLLGLASLRHIDVAEFTAIVMLSPLAVTLLAGLVLKESVTPARWALVAGGFIGTLVIIRPGSESFTWAMLLPVGLVATNSWFQVLTSRLARTEDPVTMHLYGGIFGAAMASLALPLAWSMVSDPWLLAGLVALGLLGAIGHFLLILAYRNATAATLTPYLYLQIAFAMVMGWLVFDHVPDGWSMFGMALIALCGGAGAWLTVREHRALQPAKA
jgi:drug/metabolite transporter (DMT)-like permease